MILSILIASFFIALALLIWFKSDAFIDWFKFFRLGTFIKADEYRQERMIGNDLNISYPKFLKSKYHRSMFFKIVGCPLCLCVWLSLFASSVISLGTILTLISSSYIITLTSLIGVFIIDTILQTPIICILSIYIYGRIAKILNEDK
jgi:hypothetical protein